VPVNRAEPRLRPTGTFLGAPWATDLDGCRVAALGLPFDMGSHPTRVGARSGPQHVRTHSLLVAEHLADLDIDVMRELGFRDLGDVDVTPGDVASAYPAIEAAVGRIASAGAIPLCVGGDGAVTLPQLRALSRVHGPLTVLHFDAHTDAYPPGPDEPASTYSNENPYRHAAVEGLVDVATSVHVGVRDTHVGETAGVVGVARDLGYRVITMSEFVETGVVTLLAELQATASGRPVFLCWDMDVFDPSVAAGVVTPAWGGISVREGQQLLNGLAGLHFVGFEVNTVSPPHDVAGQTGALAAQVMRECLMLAYADATAQQ
jgi:arginase family enzyme